MVKNNTKMCKSCVKPSGKLCANYLQKSVQNFYPTKSRVKLPTFSQLSPHFSSHFLTPSRPLYLTLLFNNSTVPTITTINNLIERK